MSNINNITMWQLVYCYECPSCGNNDLKNYSEPTTYKFRYSTFNKIICHCGRSNFFKLIDIQIKKLVMEQK